MVMDKDGRRESRTIAKDIKRMSQMTPAARQAMEQRMEAETVKLQTKFVSPNAGWKRIFSYYTPHWIIAVMVVLAIINSCALPVIAYLIINLQFSLYSVKTNPDWESDTQTYLIAMAIWVFCIAIFNSTEKSIFAVMGEKLTY